MDQTVAPQDQLYIGGEWRRGRGAEISSNFPADGSLNGTIAGASADNVDFAIARAQEAVNDPAWRKLLPHERATYLYKISEGIARHADRISYVQSRATGKTLAETRALAMSAAGAGRGGAAARGAGGGARAPARGGGRARAGRGPRGGT